MHSANTAPITAPVIGPVTLTRQELYDRIWAIGLTRAGAEHGLAYSQLARICIKHDIPVPRMEYWVSRQRGNPQPPSPLPTARAAPEAPVEITTFSRRRPGAAKVQDPEIAQRLQLESIAFKPIVVSDSPGALHPLVARTRCSLEESMRDRIVPKDGVYAPKWSKLESHLPAEVSPGTLDRAMRVLDALVKACEARGFAIACPPTGYRCAQIIKVMGERVYFRVRERTTKRPHVLTKQERKRKRRRGFVVTDQFDYEPNGQLLLRLQGDGGWPDLQTWADGKTKRLEQRLDEVMVALLVHADEQRRFRLQCEREAREKAEADRERLEEERRRQEEEAKVRRLVEQAEAWEKAKRIRAYVDAVERGEVTSANGDNGVTEWAAWARDVAQQMKACPRSPL